MDLFLLFRRVQAGIIILSNVNVAYIKYGHGMDKMTETLNSIVQSHKTASKEILPFKS